MNSAKPIATGTIGTPIQISANVIAMGRNQEVMARTYAHNSRQGRETKAKCDTFSR